MSNSTALLADALAASARAEGEATPAVRGADWTQEMVTAVHADGTITCGTIRARRRTTYALPQVGDLAVLTRSGMGNWIADGPLASTGNGGWTPLTLASGYAHVGGGHAPAYLIEGRRVTLRGRIGPTGSGGIPNATTLATLPTAIRPSAAVGWQSPRGGSTQPSIRCEIEPGGVLRIYDAGAPPWISLDCVSYHTI